MPKQQQIMSGRIVRTKTGELGRTFHKEDLINGKIKVHIADTVKTQKLPNGDEVDVPITFNGAKKLCDPMSLTFIGFID